MIAPMKKTPLLIPATAALALAMLLVGAGCSSGGADHRLQYGDGQVHYVDGTGHAASVHGIGGVTAVSFDPNYVRVETAEGTHVIARDRFISSSPLPIAPH
jgi:hypothetical protein